MVEKHRNLRKYWESLAVQGGCERQLALEIANLRFDYYKRLRSENKNTDTSGSYYKQLLEGLDKDLIEILEKYEKLDECERLNRRNFLKKEFENQLQLIKNQKALCKITFPSYPLYKFLTTFSKIVDESQFTIKNDGILTKCIDKSRDSLMILELKSENYLFLHEGEIGINIEDLASILKCKSSDESISELIFGEEKIFTTIKSRAFNSIIERTLKTIKSESEDISMENFNKIQYISEFSLSKEKMRYLIENSELYSKNIQIMINQNQVKFEESNNIGQGNLIWERNDFESFRIDFERIKDDLADLSIDESQTKALENIIIKQECCSKHPGSFLTHLGKIIKILEKSDSIIFKVRDGSPLKIEINISSLGCSKLSFFVVPN